MSEKKMVNNFEELSRDEQRLRGMLGALDRVEAPPDFDFRLKARIAAAAPRRDFRSWVFALRFGVPALLLLMVLGAAGLFLTRSGEVEQLARTENETRPAVAPAEESALALEDITREDPVPLSTEGSAELPPAREVVTRVPSGRSRPALPVKREAPFIGVREDAYRPAPTLNLNINSNTAPAAVREPEKPEKPVVIGVREVFDAIGINASYQEGGWRVTSVTENGLAGRSGVARGDVIEAIDDEKLPADASYVRSFSGRKVTLIRGSEKIQVVLKNR
jgi:hypothetical protein